MAPTRHCGSFHSRSGVEQNKVFAADVTQLNFNETYEVGYALGSYQINAAYLLARIHAGREIYLSVWL